MNRPLLEKTWLDTITGCHMAVGICAEGYRYEAVLDKGRVRAAVMTAPGEWYTLSEHCTMAAMIARIHSGSWREIATQHPQKETHR